MFCAKIFHRPEHGSKCHVMSLLPFYLSKSGVQHYIAVLGQYWRIYQLSANIGVACVASLPYYRTIPYHPISCHIIPCHTIPSNTIPSHAMPSHTVPYHPISYHTIPYHIIRAAQTETSKIAFSCQAASKPKILRLEYLFLEFLLAGGYYK